MRRVLMGAASAFGWKAAPAKSGRGVGIACVIDAGTYVATIAEVQVDAATGKISVLRTVCAHDMGLVVNPEGARMQIEGGLTMGLDTGNPAEARDLVRIEIAVEDVATAKAEEALASRQSLREFDPRPLPEQILSNLLWAGGGINRGEHGGRTAPSAMNAQEVLIYAAMAQGLFLYEPARHELRLIVAKDVRRVTGNQDFVDSAPLDLIYVADHTRMKLVPAAQRQAYAFVTTGAIAQNVYLYCASAGLATVLRAWFDRDALAQAMGLDADHQLLLSQTVGDVKLDKPA